MHSPSTKSVCIYILSSPLHLLEQFYMDNIKYNKQTCGFCQSCSRQSIESVNWLHLTAGNGVMKEKVDLKKLFGFQAEFRRKFFYLKVFQPKSFKDGK